MSNHVAWATHGHPSRHSSLPSYLAIHTYSMYQRHLVWFIYILLSSNCYNYYNKLNYSCATYIYFKVPSSRHMLSFKSNIQHYHHHYILRHLKYMHILYIQQILIRHVQTAIVIHKQVTDAMTRILYIILPCTHYI